jgi:threonine synthase
VALAGALAAHESGYLHSDATVVCLVTSTGFKDEPAIERIVGRHQIPCLEQAAEVDGWLDEELNQ